MSNFKPVSDLRNYDEVLSGVAVDAPVFLTQNGRGRYVIVDIDEYERQQAMLNLLTEIAKGVKSAEEHGWLTQEEVERELGI